MRFQGTRGSASLPAKFAFALDARLDMIMPVSKEDRSNFHVGRMTPARGVHLDSGHPVIVWFTVCTKDREAWLTHADVMNALHRIWLEEATAWQVGDFLLMPDHLHGFCAPAQPAVDIEAWVAFWKSRFSRTHSGGAGRWQRGVFHHRLRSLDEYREKWIYTMENPLRKGCVQRWEDWPWRGKVHDLQW